MARIFCEKMCRGLLHINRRIFNEPARSFPGLFYLHRAYMKRGTNRQDPTLFIAQAHFWRKPDLARYSALP